MKLHLSAWNPPTPHGLTVCGIKTRYFQTTEPLEVDCGRCLGSYLICQDYYDALLKQPTEQGRL